MALEIFPAVPEDAPLVHHIMRTAFAEHAALLDPPSGATTETVDDVRAAIEEHGAVLAWDGSTAVGSARFQRQPEYLYIGRLAVLPAYRGRGIGSAITHFLEGLALDSGIPRVRLGARMSLPQNVEFFQRLGYELVSVEPHPRGPDRIATLIKRLK